VSISLDLISKKLPCQPLLLHRLLLPPPPSLLRRCVNYSFVPGQVVYAMPPPKEKPKEKTIFNVKLESFEATSKPKVIKEVKAMVPNLTLIEVRPTVTTPVLSEDPHKSFVLFRRRSSLSRYQRFSRRTCPRRMLRSSRRSLRVSGLSSPWSKLSLIAHSIYLLPLHSLHSPSLSFKTFLPFT
jgi:hypothetical protein